MGLKNFDVTVFLEEAIEKHIDALDYETLRSYCLAAMEPIPAVMDTFMRAVDEGYEEEMALLHPIEEKNSLKRPDYGVESETVYSKLKEDEQELSTQIKQITEQLEDLKLLQSCSQNENEREIAEIDSQLFQLRAKYDSITSKCDGWVIKSDIDWGCLTPTHQKTYLENPKDYINKLKQRIIDNANNTAYFTYLTVLQKKLKEDSKLAPSENKALSKIVKKMLIYCAKFEQRRQRCLDKLKSQEHQEFYPEIVGKLSELITPINPNRKKLETLREERAKRNHQKKLLLSLALIGSVAAVILFILMLTTPLGAPVLITYTATAFTLAAAIALSSFFSAVSKMVQNWYYNRKIDRLTPAIMESEMEPLDQQEKLEEQREPIQLEIDQLTKEMEGILKAAENIEVSSEKKQQQGTFFSNQTSSNTGEPTSREEAVIGRFFSNS